MKRITCSRAWEAEAIEDGRLDGLGRASFDRHLVTCEVCAHERAVWLQLRALIKTLPSPSSTPLERKRLRMLLLGKANGQSIKPAAQHWRRRLVPALAVIVLAVGSWRWQAFRSGSHDVPTAGPSYEVRPLGEADWKIERAGPATELRLAKGAVSIHVVKLNPEQRFRVLLPDGELEVRGTRFTAEVVDGNTDRIEVIEGAVTVRIQSEPPRTLAAGERWHPALAPTDPSVPETTAPETNAVPPPSSPARPVAPRRSTASTPADSAGRSTRSSAGIAFAAVMDAFNAGSFARAEELIADFERKCGSDPRIEDLDFLRIILRTRAGDERGARQRAHAYLARHPKGLRHAEVEAFLRNERTDSDEHP